MGPTAAEKSLVPSRKIVDMLLGAVVMGTVGTLLGLLMGGGALPVAVGLGVLLGTVVGIFEGRRLARKRFQLALEPGPRWAGFWESNFPCFWICERSGNGPSYSKTRNRQGGPTVTLCERRTFFCGGLWKIEVS